MLSSKTKDKENIVVQSSENQEIDSQIEALLYIARRPVSIDEIQEVIPNKSKEKLLNIIYQLIERYYEYNSALEIVELSNLRFELTLKDYMVNSIEHFTLGNMLKSSEIKTLSVIAYFQPNINRPKLYEHLGNTSSVYQSIRSLKKLNLVNEIKKELHLTDHFYDYFKLDSKDPDLVKSFLDYFKN